MTDLRSLAFDPEYAAGARSAIRTCLRLEPEERVTIIADTRTADIASSMLHQADAVGSPSSVFILEDLAHRPLQGMPQAILEDLARSRVSVFAAQAQQGELHARMQVFEVEAESQAWSDEMVIGSQPDEVSCTVRVWRALALLPQASAAVQSREMTLDPPQLLLTLSL